MSDVTSAQASNPNAGSASSPWAGILANLGAGGYEALNQVGMGLPDYILKIADSPAYQNLHNFLSRHSAATGLGGIVGGLDSLLVPGGGGLRAISELEGRSPAFRAGSYEALNQAGMGLPDYALKTVDNPAYQNLQGFLSQHPTAKEIGGAAGLLGSLAIPVGGELEGAGALARGIGLGKVADVLRSGADIASGATPVSGLLGNIFKGALQAAPQALMRTATGNITPQQGTTGLLLGGALGGVSGILGGALGKEGGALKKLGQEATISGLGVTPGMLSREASFGLSPRQVLTKALNAQSIKQNIYDLSRKFGLDTLDKWEQWDDANVKPIFNAVDKVWSQKGLPLSDLVQSALKNPNAEDFKAALANPMAKQRLEEAFNILSQEGDPVPLSKLRDADSAMHQQANAAGPTGGVAQLPLRTAANGMSDLRNIAEDAAMKDAEKEGIIKPGELDFVKKMYPAIHTMRQAYGKGATGLFSVSPGSATMNKLAVEAIFGGAGGIGGGLANPNASPSQRLQNELLGAFAGAAGGDILNRVVSRGATQGIGKLASFLEGGAGGGGGQIGQALASAAGGGGILSKIAAKEPIMAALFGHAEPAPVANPISSSPFPNGPPTYEQLIQSDNPYYRLIAQGVANAYGSSFAFLRNAEGNRYSIDDVVKKAYQETNGFSPESSQFFLTAPGENPQAVSQDVQIAKALNGIDWKGLENWYGGLMQGKAPALGRQLAGALDIGSARAIQQQMQQLLNAIPPSSRAVVENQIDRVMKLPNLSTQQREEMAQEAVLNTEGLFYNPGLMKSLGFVR